MTLLHYTLSSYNRNNSWISKDGWDHSLEGCNGVFEAALDHRHAVRFCWKMGIEQDIEESDN